MRPARPWPGPGTFPVSHLGPRCDRTLVLDGRFERGGVAGDPGKPPRCGRPEGHNGPCRSEAAVARYVTAGRERRRARGPDGRWQRRKAAAQRARLEAAR